MQNNANVKVDGIENAVTKRIENIRMMTDDQIKEFEDELKKQSAIIKSRIDLVSLLAGRDIGDKGFEALKEMMPDELIEAINEGATFEDRQVPSFDQKTKQMTTRTVYASPEAIMASQATDKIASADELLIIKYGLNKYEMRRAHGQAFINALNSAKRAIVMVKKERKDAEMKKQIDAKKIKVTSVVLMGKKLLASLPEKKEEKLLTA